MDGLESFHASCLGRSLGRTGGRRDVDGAFPEGFVSGGAMRCRLEHAEVVPLLEVVKPVGEQVWRDMVELRLMDPQGPPGTQLRLRVRQGEMAGQSAVRAGERRAGVARSLGRCALPSATQELGERQ